MDEAELQKRLNLAKLVRKRMIDVGISQRELAAKVPMRYQYLNNMLFGLKSGEKYWGRIMELLGMEQEPPN